MANEVTWLLPNRVIYFQAKDVLTIDELVAAIKFIEDGVRNAPGVVHLVVDARETKSIPSNVLEIKKHITYLNRDKMGWIILIGMNPLVNAFVKVLTQLLRTNYRNFRAQKPALEFLVTQDETLSDVLERVTD
ncbi:MAG: hypothetical protein ABI690_06940 [Chloroflexota bacterium]